MKKTHSKLGPDMVGFLELKESLGYSRHSYEYQLSKIDEYVANHDPLLDVIDEDTVVGWSKKKEGESKNTRRIRLHVIREFGKYQRGIGKDAFVLPSDLIDRQQPFIPYLFTDEELARLFCAIDAVPFCTSSPNREYILPVLFRMLYCCALRPNEPLMLIRQDVDLARGTLYIKNSKRHRDRTVMMSDDLLHFCRTYDRMMGPRPYFFTSPALGPYSSGWMDTQFKLCRQRAGIRNGNQIPRPYDLRHAACSRVILKWLSEGKDFYELAIFLREHMGHGSFAGTFYYIHLLPEHIIRNAGIDWHRFDCLYPEVADEEA